MHRIHESSPTCFSEHLLQMLLRKCACKYGDWKCAQVYPTPAKDNIFFNRSIRGPEYFDCLKFHAYFQPPPPQDMKFEMWIENALSVNVPKRRKQRSLLRSPEDIRKIFNVAKTLLNWQKWACANYYHHLLVVSESACEMLPAVNKIT